MSHVRKLYNISQMQDWTREKNYAVSTNGKSFRESTKKKLTR